MRTAFLAPPQIDARASVNQSSALPPPKMVMSTQRNGNDGRGGNLAPIPEGNRGAPPRHETAG
jgi:hypothetical protein